MRKKSIGMARAYIGFYIWFAFGAGIPALLSFKFSSSLSIGILLGECLCLVGVICSHVFYNKNLNKPFYICGIASYTLFDAFVIYGLVLEIIFTGQGEPAPYAWMISIASLVLLAVFEVFVGLGMYRTKHPREIVNAW